ncbi:MAG: outer membrane lipoprotein-sorting protein [Candidatus Binatia bacterium]|nr:outer membrane lipoprotein-sorting protein [Candidatus Binatia bacterium]
MLAGLGLFALLALVPVSTFALDGGALLASSAKMNAPAGWSDRKSVMIIESFANDDKFRERRAEVKESLGEDLKVSSLSKFLGPADVLGLRVLDIWGAEEGGDAWVWAPSTRRFQKIATGQSDDAPAYGNEPSYRDAQLLDLLPRMAEDVEATVVDEETVDGMNMAVIDVDVGDRDWPFGKKFRVWVSTDDELIRKIEARKPGGAVSRRVTVMTYAQADGRNAAVKVSVENPASKRVTTFVRSDLEFDRGIPERAFSLRDLSKGR